MDNILSGRMIEEPKLLSILDSLEELENYYDELNSIFGNGENIYYMTEDGTLDRDDYYKAKYQYELLDRIFSSNNY